MFKKRKKRSRKLYYTLYERSRHFVFSITEDVMCDLSIKYQRTERLRAKEKKEIK
jgi:hypothetical protein